MDHKCDRCCMEDCIHLKACRRLSKIAVSNDTYLARGCNKMCSAYTSINAVEQYVINSCGDSMFLVLQNQELFHHDEEKKEILVSGVLWDHAKSRAGILVKYLKGEDKQCRA